MFSIKLKANNLYKNMPRGEDIIPANGESNQLQGTFTSSYTLIGSTIVSLRINNQLQIPAVPVITMPCSIIYFTGTCSSCHNNTV